MSNSRSYSEAICQEQACNELMQLLTGTHLRHDPALILQVHLYFVIARRRRLVLLSKRQTPLLERRLHHADAGGQDDLPALAHPDRGLVRSLEAVNLRVGVIVRSDRDIVLSCLCDPARHPEGWGDRGDHPSRAVGRVAAVPDHPARFSVRILHRTRYVRVYVVHGIAERFIERRRRRRRRRPHRPLGPQMRVRLP